MMFHSLGPLAALLLCCGLRSHAPDLRLSASASRPNVLVIVMDDISDRDMDRIATPQFDALAAGGMRFRRAYSAPVCSPARRMLTFGNYWHRDSGTPCTGQNYAKAQPSTDSISLPRLFRDAGYATALIGKWHLGSFPGVAEGEPWQLAPQKHGFQTWRAGLSANIKSSCLARGTYTNWQRVDDLELSTSAEHNTQAVGDAAVAWIQERAAQLETPWFGMVCFQAAHGPFHIPPGMGVKHQSYSFRAQFELMVQDLDRAVGQILESVDLQETLVILVGDNGTPEKVPFAKGEQGRGKTTTFEGGIRVPMVWAGAGVRAGSESSALVSFVDVLPTLAARIGVQSEAIEALDGLSIENVLADPEARAHDFVWSGCIGPNVAPGGDFAVVTERWKLRMVQGQSFLYDLQADPEERHDLAQDKAGAAAVGELQYEQVMEQLKALHLQSLPSGKRK